jgi:hypothetical protein
MADKPPSGLTTAVELALRAEAAAAQEVEEEEEPVLDLLGLQNLDAAPKRANLARAGKGRPPGARNHSTQFWCDYISRKYGSPLEVLAQMMRMPIVDLARELNCSKLDAFTEKRKAAEALAPYMHPKLSSVAIYPPGDVRGGIPSTLILDTQDFDVVEDAAIVETAPVADDTERPRASTLSLAEQEPVAATVETQVEDAIVSEALDALIRLARSDPRYAEEIRCRLGEVPE